FNQGSMNFPVADTFQRSKLLLCCFDCPFSAGSRSDGDRALAASKEALVSGNFVDKANAVVRHHRPQFRLDMGSMPWRAFGPNDLNQSRPRCGRQNWLMQTVISSLKTRVIDLSAPTRLERETACLGASRHWRAALARGTRTGDRALLWIVRDA